MQKLTETLKILQTEMLSYLNFVGLNTFKTSGMVDGKYFRQAAWTIRVESVL